jgi:hypothetical protein
MSLVLYSTTNLPASSWCPQKMIQTLYREADWDYGNRNEDGYGRSIRGPHGGVFWNMTPCTAQEGLEVVTL